MRFVNESNSKGIESPSVIGVNNQIQSAGSDIIKQAGTKVRKYLRQSNSNIYIINCSHDEIVMLGDGYCVPTIIWKD